LNTNQFGEYVRIEAFLGPLSELLRNALSRPQKKPGFPKISFSIAADTTMELEFSSEPGT